MKWSNPLLVAALILLFPSLSLSPALAQRSSSPAALDTALPDAPQPAQSVAANDPQQAGSGSIAGTVLDANHDVVQGALVTLAGSSGSATASVTSGSSGEFTFTGLPPDVYRLAVTAPGMLPYNSIQIPLQAGETRLVPPITLSVFGGTTNVTVNGSAEELSEQQAQVALQQRIVGVIPNFYSTYDWNAPPMLPKQKFQLGIRSVIDPVSLLGVAVTAGAEQYQNVFPAYGSGLEGYGKRYGAAFANHVSATLLGRAVYPSLFHQDPRYFYKGKGSFRSRALYAISSAFVTRSDDGRRRPNYSRLLGNFSAAAISNLYYPASDRGGSLVVLNGLATTGGDIIANLTREFLLRRFTSHVPKSGNGEP